MTIRIPGLALTDHTLQVPLDHADPGGPTIEVFAREAVAVDKIDDDLPWLVFLQGGPGGESPRPMKADGWLGHVTKTHRVLLLDQRGCGRSTPVTARSTDGMSAAEIAAYVRHFRADSIVADAEMFREKVAGGKPWTTLGQSYGGFITLTYLSQAPEGLTACLVTGGLSGIDASAADVYAHTFPRIARKNAAYYERYPDDVAAVRHIADHLAAHEVLLPDGSRLTPERFRLIGSIFGMSYGFEHVHWLLDTAWDGDDISDRFRQSVLAETSYANGPIYALQEYCYGLPGTPTGWAADHEIAARPEFAADADPLLFTGETMFRWMFDQIPLLQPFAEAADILAAVDDWPALYDEERLAANTVPVAAAVYFDDMYVDADLSLDTARRVGNVRPWVTNEFEHDGLRSGSVVERLMDMVAGKI
ncbi:alpha/beta hydrolase [Flexivirga endophytica]|uniref:Alpha/beta hydrolase n=1 Tax=Flexivirga endophytica TaxID=1849103 RepID=A0A916TKL3_9MICO|nr:alpha/beta fold hydrolase [Flexivirga endophytica]GGB45812.1 alpha/beta hydrolase [Flexivirga endophytica]GHB66232.1 alpha/beta hydrolase [Flexivirga endophytica]